MTTPPTLEPLSVDTRQAARLLGVCPRTVVGLTTSGELPSFKLGARRLFAVDTLRAFIRAREQLDTPVPAVRVPSTA